MYGIFQRLQRLFTTRFVSTKQNKTNTLKLRWIMATLAGRFKQNSLDSNVCKMFELLSFFHSFLFFPHFQKWMCLALNVHGVSFEFLLVLLLFFCDSFIMAKWKIFCFTASIFVSLMSCHIMVIFTSVWSWSVFSFSLLFLAKINTEKYTLANKYM